MKSTLNCEYFEKKDQSHSLSITESIDRDLENLQHQFQMQISPKPKTFSQFFIASMKSTLNSEYFEKKDQSHSLSITEIIDCENGSY